MEIPYADTIHIMYVSTFPAIPRGSKWRRCLPWNDQWGYAAGLYSCK